MRKAAASVSTPVAILCGGLGTRLAAALPGRQKTMAEVSRRPFLDILVRWAAGQGFKRFVLCAGHRGDSVEAYFRSPEWPAAGLSISCSREGSPLGTGGALRLAGSLLRSPEVLVLNGDSYCPLGLSGLLRFHARAGARATVAVVEPGTRRDGGFVKVGARGRILSFREKDYGPSCFLNAGVYVLGREALEALPEGASSLERDLFPALVGRGLFACRSAEPLWDIGTPERLEAFRKAWEVDRVR